MAGLTVQSNAVKGRAGQCLQVQGRTCIAVSQKSWQFENLKFHVLALSKVSTVICHGIEEWCIIFKKSARLFQNWYKEWKVWNFEISCPHFVQSIITPLKIFRGVEQCNNSDTKFAENVTGCFKNDKRNLVNFSQAVESLKIWNFISSFFRKYTFLELEIFRGVMFHRTEESCIIWRE